MVQRRFYSLRDVRLHAQRRTGNWYDTWFTRRVSAWITFCLAPFGITPNQISLANTGVGLLGCGLIAWNPTAATTLVGVALVHLYAVLDSVDGELARLKGVVSLKGMFLEDWSAYAMITAFPFAVALYLYRTGSPSLVLGVAIAFATLGRNAMPALRRALYNGRITASSRARPTTSTRSWQQHVAAILDNTVLNHTNIRVVLTTVVVLDVMWTGFRTPLEWVYYGYVTGLFAKEAGILWLALRGDLIDWELHKLAHAEPPHGVRDA